MFPMNFSFFNFFKNICVDAVEDPYLEWFSVIKLMTFLNSSSLFNSELLSKGICEDTTLSIISRFTSYFLYSELFSLSFVLVASSSVFVSI